MIEPIQSIQFMGRVTAVSESDGSACTIKDLIKRPVMRSVTVDLGPVGSVNFNYTSSESGGLAFVKRGDLVQVTLGTLGASPYDAG